MSPRKEDGYILVDGREVATTLQCCHCGNHWVRVPGSGTRRGYCVRCNGHVCGRKRCLEHCYPFQQQLDDYDAWVNRGKISTGPYLPLA